MSKEIPKKPSREMLLQEPGPSLEAQIAWYRYMQKNQPIRYRPEYNLWDVFRYKDVQQVLSDYATFSSEKSMPEGFPGALMLANPPQHRQLRSLVSKAFTPRRVEQLTPHIVQLVDELLAPVMAGGKMDVITGLAYQLPVRVIAEMLGLPLEDQARFRQWAYQLIAQMMGVRQPENNELISYFSDLLNERKRNPHDDLISALLSAEENGTRLTREEIIHMCLELVMAGSVTTTILVGRMFARLAASPEIYQALRADPALIPGTIEEVLRYHFSPFHVWRSACRDTVLHGHEIKAGQYVMAWTAAANFDETYFPHPEQFDIKRASNPHLTFGYGIHHCIGAPLGRLEGRIVLERVIAHFSEVCDDPDNPVQYMDQMGSVRLAQSLGIRFTPA